MAGWLRISKHLAAPVAPAEGWEYLIALGSNIRHHRHGAPEVVLAAALRALDAAGLRVERAAPVIRTRPLGPARRCFANSAAVVRSRLDPLAMLRVLKAIEADFGRRRGQRWGPRVLDLDIVLWQGGRWCSGRRAGARAGGKAGNWLMVPHPALARRGFVLGPGGAIAGAWRDPTSGCTLRQLHARLTRPRPNSRVG